MPIAALVLSTAPRATLVDVLGLATGIFTRTKTSMRAVCRAELAAGQTRQ